MQRCASDKALYDGAVGVRSKFETSADELALDINASATSSSSGTPRLGFEQIIHSKCRQINV